jgi:hypothetical protein
MRIPLSDVSFGKNSFRRNEFCVLSRGATSGTVKVKSPLVVSIHAPARGATLKLAVIRIDLVVSIHAPARGATQHGF